MYNLVSNSLTTIHNSQTILVLRRREKEKR